MSAMNTWEGHGKWDFGGIHTFAWKAFRCSAAIATSVPEVGAVQIAISGPDTKENTIRNALLTTIAHAKESVWLSTPYFVPDQEILVFYLERMNQCLNFQKMYQCIKPAFYCQNSYYKK